MDAQEVFTAIGIYLLLGLAVLALFDLITGRVRRRLKDASFETQSKMVVRAKTAIVITVIALWMFWPLAIYSAIVSQFKSGGNE